MIKIYEYSNCSTCKKALKFLEKRKISYEKIPITEHPPSESELKKMIHHLDGDFRKLFNTSGQVYRELGLSTKLSSMTAQEAIKLLAKNGRLVKRPFVLTPDHGMVGFKEPEWKKVF